MWPQCKPTSKPSAATSKPPRTESLPPATHITDHGEREGHRTVNTHAVRERLTVGQHASTVGVVTFRSEGSAVPTVILNDGHLIPRLGFGVFQVPPDQAFDTVSTALQAGYRSIDTAAAYQNEAGVGRAIAESGLAREDVYVTTKLWNSEQGYDSTLRAFDASMDKLG
ncbi:MAG: aldo/keto reductase, partial [Nocardia sp.]|nr:aldo/keto reductase [Nocardia sp.]